MIITKRADELKPGDIIVKKVGRREVVIKAYPLGNDAIGVYSIELDSSSPQSPPMPWANHRTFDVEALDLTPAQKHADKLVELLRDSVDWHVRNERADGSNPNSEWVSAARDLLDEIDPPEPPTYEELLAALSNVTEDGSGHVAAKELINRARNAGVLK